MKESQRQSQSRIGLKTVYRLVGKYERQQKHKDASLDTPETCKQLKEPKNPTIQYRR